MDDDARTLPQQLRGQLHDILRALAVESGCDPLDLALDRVAEMDSLAVLETSLLIESLTGVELTLDDASRCETLRDLVSLALTKRALEGPERGGEQ